MHYLRCVICDGTLQLCHVRDVSVVSPIPTPSLPPQALYGPPKETPRPEENRPTTRRPIQKPATGEDPILCSEASVDALITAGSQKQTYVFKGSHYWRLTDTGVEKSYPRLISRYWKGVPDNIDAAFSWPQNNRIYFFKVMCRFSLKSGAVGCEGWHQAGGESCGNRFLEHKNVH